MTMWQWHQYTDLPWSWCDALTPVFGRAELTARPVPVEVVPCDWSWCRPEFLDLPSKTEAITRPTARRMGFVTGKGVAD